MKYRNSAEVIPAELLEEIQKYVQGEYIYISVKDWQNYYKRKK